MFWTENRYFIGLNFLFRVRFQKQVRFITTANCSARDRKVIHSFRVSLEFWMFLTFYDVFQPPQKGGWWWRHCTMIIHSVSAELASEKVLQHRHQLTTNLKPNRERELLYPLEQWLVNNERNRLNFRAKKTTPRAEHLLLTLSAQPRPLLRTTLASKDNFHGKVR